MLWFVNILCKTVKSTAVYFSYFVSQALTFFDLLFSLFVLFWGLALFHLKEDTGLTILFPATANSIKHAGYSISFYHLLLFVGSETQHRLKSVVSQVLTVLRVSSHCFELGKKRKAPFYPTDK